MSTTTLPTNTPTAPLPAPAAAALARLESAFPEALAEQHRVERIVSGLRNGESTVINGTPVTAVSLEVAEAITRYEIAAERKAALEAKPTRTWSGADFDAWVGCERTILDSVTTLTLAGRTDLIDADVDPVIRAAADFRKQALHAAELAAQSASGEDLPAVDIRSWEFAEELMAGYKATLAKAGRLDLIGGAS